MANSDWWEQTHLDKKGGTQLEEYNPFKLLEDTPLLTQAIHDDRERTKRLQANSKRCTIVFELDQFFETKFPISMDYSYITKKFPFTAKDHGPYPCEILFDIKANATTDIAIHDIVRFYHHKNTIHIFEGDYK